MKPVLIGIAGGSGSGKTFIANRIIDVIGNDNAVLIQHDSYYSDIGKYDSMPVENINFDHPDSLETDLLIEHLNDLIDGRAIYQPLYDYATHRRLIGTKKIEPKHLIILDGILIFADRILRELMDLKIFIDTSEDERFNRRLHRDVQERGRSAESVINQFLRTVKPMHMEFVEPYKHVADMIIRSGSNDSYDLDLAIKKIHSLIGSKS